MVSVVQSLGRRDVDSMRDGDLCSCDGGGGVDCSGRKGGEGGGVVDGSDGISGVGDSGGSIVYRSSGRIWCWVRYLWWRWWKKWKW